MFPGKPKGFPGFFVCGRCRCRGGVPAPPGFLGLEELAVLLLRFFTLCCCFHPISLVLPKETGWSPKERRLGWWRPREVSGPARLSHSRGRCHSAAKVSASRTDLITRRHGEGLGLDVDWRLKVFCPAFLQKSGRGPGAEPMDARRSARNSPCAKEAQEGVKGGTLAGGSPFAGGLSRPQSVRFTDARCHPTPGGGGTPPLRGVGGTWWGRRWPQGRVVEDADPYGGWETDRVPPDLQRGYPTPGRGGRNAVRLAKTVTAGRRGRRPLQGGCGDVGLAVIQRPGAGVGPRPYRGWRNAVTLAVDRPLQGGCDLHLCEKTAPAALQYASRGDKIRVCE